ncbi:MAG: hypothetical protein ACQETH_03060 [Candidatus Rifleibacteriota bacterium]
MTLNKKYHNSRLIFDFPSPKAAKFTSADIRRKTTLAAKSVFSAKNQPVLLKYSRDKAKCFSRKSLFFFMPCRQKSLTRLRFARLKLFPVSYNQAKLIKENNTKLKVDKRLALSHQIHIKHASLKDFFFSTFVQGAKPDFFSYIPRPVLFRHKKICLSLITEGADFDIYRFNSPASLLLKSLNFKQVLLKDFKTTDFAPYKSLNCKYIPLKNADYNFLFYRPTRNDLNLKFKRKVEEFFPDYNHLSLHNYKVAPSKLRSNLEKCFNFDLRNEIGKNLVIEVNTRLAPKSGKLAPVTREDREKLNFLKVDKKNIGIKHFKMQPAKFSAENARILASKNIKANRQDLKKIHKISSDSQRLEGKFICKTRATESVQKSRLALKLKLKCYAFKNITYKYESIFKKINLPCPAGLINHPTFCADYKGIKLKEKPIGKYRMDFFRTLFKPARNCRKKNRLKFLTQKHGRYSALSLKRIKLPALKKAAYKTGYNFNQLCRQSIESGDYRFRNFVHLTGIFKDFITLLARPKSFLMSVTRLSFTEIVLPMHRRKLKGQASNYWHFSTGLHKFKPMKSLENYCFKQQNLQELEFISPAPKRKRLVCNKKLRVNTPVNHSNLLLKDDFKAFELNQEKPLKASIHKTIPAVSILDGLPDQICSLLKLELNIIKFITGGKLNQTTIIEPPPWQFRTKPYFCAIKLMPFQFGFPSFCIKKIKLLTLDETSKPAITDSDDSSLKINYFHFTPKTRTFRSKYSLKEPKSWLFKNDLLRRLTRTQQAYYGSSSSVDQSFYCPPAPDKYPFSNTFRQQRPQLEKQEFDSFFGNMAEIRQDFQSFATYWFQPEVHTNFTVSEISPITGQKVTRLLVSSVSLECKTKSDKEFKYPISKRKYRTFNKNLKFNLKHSRAFKTRDSKNIFNYKPIFAFYNNFPAIKHKININLEEYQTRFRQFFFPYYPEFLNRIENKFAFFNIEEATQTQDFDPSEEFRTSNIIEFAPVGVEFKTNYACLFSHKVHSSVFFNEARISIPKPELQKYLTVKESNLTRLNYESKNQFELTSAKKEKLVRTINYEIGQKISKLSQRKVIRFAKKQKIKLYKLRLRLDSRIQPFKNFDMTAIHWVILLSNFLKIYQNKLNYSLKSPVQPDYPETNISSKLTSKFKFCSKPYSKLTTKNLFDKIDQNDLIYSITPIERGAQAYNSPDLIKSYPRNAEFSFAKLPQTTSLVLKDRLSLIKKEASPISFEPDLPESKAIKKENKKLKLFKMDDKIIKDWQFNKVKAKRSVSSKSSYHHPTTPDWYDIEMDNPSFYVDTNNNKNSKSIFS